MDLNRRVSFFSGLIVALAALAISATPAPCVAQTDVSGTISGEIWTSGASPYRVVGDIQVNDLQIDAGVQVAFTGDFVFRVAGELRAVGAVNDSITFTTEQGVTNWRGIEFSAGSSAASELALCVVEYANNSGIRVEDCFPRIHNCTLRNNQSANSGGGLYVSLASIGELTVSECVIVNNVTSRTYGGGVYVASTGGSVRLIGCTVDNNQALTTNASVFGGGGFVSGAVTITNCSFSGNYVYGNDSIPGGSSAGRGGGLYVGGGSIVIENSVFCDNYARGYAVGGMSGNRGYSSGGGLHLAGGQLNIANCNISFNRATSSHGSYGSGIAVVGDSANIVNCTLASNVTTGIHREGGTVEARNCILWDNNGGSVQYTGFSEIYYSDIQGYSGTDPTNIIFDPRFEDAGVCGGLRIDGTSPCIDAGDPSPQYNDRSFPPSYGSVRNDIGAHGGPAIRNFDLPVISIVDAPDDQGDTVIVNWDRFPADEPGATEPIVEYVIQQAPVPFEAPITGWIDVASVPATGAGSYATTITTEESYIVDEYWPFYVYRIVAVTNNIATEFVSNTNIGMAIDNIAPHAPDAALAEDPTRRQILLSPYDLTSLTDFEQICVYRGGWNVPGQVFYPVEATLWDEAIVPGSGSPMDPCTIETASFVIWEESHRSMFYYLVRARDVHGNLSASAADTLYPSIPSDVEREGLPPRFDLAQNFPNPFNPKTTIRFDLPAPRQTSLVIYDIAGRKVRTLIAGESLAAQEHFRTWDGKNERGATVAAGVYFYRLDADEFSATKRMILVR